MKNFGWSPPQNLHLELAWAMHHERPGGWLHFDERMASASLWGVLSGELRVESDGKTQIAQEDDWVWRPPCGARRVSVHSGGASWLSVGIIAQSGGKNWFAPPRPLLFRADSHHNRGAQMMQLLVEAHQVKASRLEIEGLSRALMGWSWTFVDESQWPRQFPNWLENALQILAREPGTTVAQLAREAHFSPAQFRRLWEKHLGVSPRESVMRRRLEMARELLENEDSSVAEIAAQSGFAGAPQLSRAFRSAFGAAPLEWKRAARERI